MQQLALGLLYLFPNAKPLVDYMVVDDGVKTFIYEWKLPDPQPTDEQLTAAIAAYYIAHETNRTQEATALQTIRTTAQGCVGRSITDAFTAQELKSLLFVLLQKTGALKRGVIKPLNEW